MLRRDRKTWIFSTSRAFTEVVFHRSEGASRSSAWIKAQDLHGNDGERQRRKCDTTWDEPKNRMELSKY